MKTYCNPIDILYHFKLTKEYTREACREGADPGAVYWKGKYWLASSKAAGIYWSEDLQDWHCVRDDVLPHQCYGPDLFVRNGNLYYDAGFYENTCVFQAVDPEHGKWIPVGKPYNLFDQQFFPDDDGKMYIFYGCNVNDPIFGVEADPETFSAKGEFSPMVYADVHQYGWERGGENNTGSIECVRQLRLDTGMTIQCENCMDQPWNEGCWVMKHNGRYYLLNSCGGTEYNIYSQGVSVSEHPLGPYVRQADNPYSLKPGGFITGAGHACSFQDKYGNLFHLANCRVSARYLFERRIGMYPAGYMEDGTLYCHQRFGDYPHYLPESYNGDYHNDLFTGWMLQSYHAPVTASSSESGFAPENAVDECIRTFWAADPADVKPEFTVDLQHETHVRAIQVNFAERHCQKYGYDGPDTVYRYIVSVSTDGIKWNEIADMSRNDEDKTHRYHEVDCHVRYVRVTVLQAAAGGVAAISGLRVFGNDGSAAPEAPSDFSAVRDAADPVRVFLKWKKPADATGINIRWGVAKDRMHHCWQFDGESDGFTLSSLDANGKYFIAVEAYGRGGVSPLSEIVEI